MNVNKLSFLHNYDRLEHKLLMASIHEGRSQKSLQIASNFAYKLVTQEQKSPQGVGREGDVAGVNSLVWNMLILGSRDILQSDKRKKRKTGKNNQKGASMSLKKRVQPLALGVE